MISSPFFAYAQDELRYARTTHAPLNSAHEGYAVILEEVDELWQEIKSKRNERDQTAMLVELAHIAAMAGRIAEDLSLIPTSNRVYP